MEENTPDENSSVQFIEEVLLIAESPEEKSIKEGSVEEASECKASEEKATEEKSADVEIPEAEIASPKLLEMDSSDQQKPIEEQKKSDAPKDKEKKVPRRRSSIGSKIASAFIAPGTEDTMSPVEPRKSVRPRRSVQMRQIFQPPVISRPVPQPAKPVRYSFDLGERIVVKSCLKGSTSSAPARSCVIPPPKSNTQKAADKVLKKYRKSGNTVYDKTPMRRKSLKLKFDNVCSIRVITPRPDYNPDKFAFPDDETENLDPHRERLSTVKLQLTPQSQSEIGERQESDIVQFNATMVFGDGEPNPSSSSNSEEDVIMTAIEPVLFVGPFEDSEHSKVEKKKKSSRRKSLIIGSASPMKSPAKIEKARLEEGLESITVNLSDPPRRSRRSVRLNKDAIELPTDESDVVLLEREDSSQKKRVLSAEMVPTEPIPKRSRRKSKFIEKDEVIAAEMKTEKKKENEKQRKIDNFFSPKNIGDKPKQLEKEKIQKVGRKTRRSSAYFGSADASDDSSNHADAKVMSEATIVITQSLPSTSTEELTETELVAGTETTIVASSSSSSSSHLVGFNSVDSPNLGKLADIFKSPAQRKKVLQGKNSEAPISTQNPAPSTPNSASKLFSLFSPKPKTKTDFSEKQTTITLSDSPMVSKSKETVKSPKKSVGVKRQERWGDKYPESYEFMLKMPTQRCVFDEMINIPDESIFKSRPFDVNIFDVNNIESNLREIACDDTNLLIKNKKKDRNRIEKRSVPEGSNVLSLFPSAMEYLVEGAEEEETIRGWLKKWKKRVRKEIELELKREKEKQKQGSSCRKGRRKKDDDGYDDDEDYEDESYDLENPLVLIGPTGVGKTALIRALAKQENMRIISMGPETDRSGMEIRKHLQEALRSHRIDQQPSKSISAFFTTIENTTFTKRKEHDPKEFIQSLIVFEHVDVFFDTLDRSAINALIESVNESKVPVVFTCENDWPRRSGQLELKRRYLEVRLGRNEFKIQKYVQNVVYSCSNVYISDSEIRQLSESVNHDLKGLLHQAHLFALAPKKPFPLTSRHRVPNGFGEDWEKPRQTLKNEDTNERLEALMDIYSEVLPHCSINPCYPEIERAWDLEQRKLAERQSGHLEGLQSAYEALNGRYSKRDLVLDVLPLLVPIDRVERRKKSNSRRHLHRFKTIPVNHSSIPTDGDLLISVVGGWSFN